MGGELFEATELGHALRPRTNSTNPFMRPRWGIHTHKEKPTRTVHAPDGAERGAPEALLEGQGEDNGAPGDEEEQPGGEVGVLGEVP